MQSDNCLSQSREETQTLTTSPSQQLQTQTITQPLPQPIIDSAQLLRQCKEQIEELLIQVGQHSRKVRKNSQRMLELISKGESQIMRVCLLCQSIDYSDQNKMLTQFYTEIQNTKLELVQQLQQAITTINQYNNIANQCIRKYQQATHKTDLNQYINCIRNSLDENLLKGIPTPILLMIGPALNNK